MNLYDGSYKQIYNITYSNGTFKFFTNIFPDNQLIRDALSDIKVSKDVDIIKVELREEKSKKNPDKIIIHALVYFNIFGRNFATWVKDLSAIDLFMGTSFVRKLEDRIINAYERQSDYKTLYDSILIFYNDIEKDDNENSGTSSIKEKCELLLKNGYITAYQLKAFMQVYGIFGTGKYIYSENDSKNNRSKKILKTLYSMNLNNVIVSRNVKDKFDKNKVFKEKYIKILTEYICPVPEYKIFNISLDIKDDEYKIIVKLSIQSNDTQSSSNGYLTVTMNDIYDNVNDDLTMQMYINNYLDNHIKRTCIPDNQ